MRLFGHAGFVSTRCKHRERGPHLLDDPAMQRRLSWLCVHSCVRNSTHTFGKVGSLKCQLCRSPGLIVVTYIASTILVLMLLCYTIHVTLQENTEAGNTDREGEDAAPKESVKVSELLRVCTHSLTHSLARSLACVHLCFPALLTCTLACSHALMYFLTDVLKQEGKKKKDFISYNETGVQAGVSA